MTDALIREAIAKRDAALKEASRWDDFISQYHELVAELPKSVMSTVGFIPPEHKPVGSRVAETEEAAIAAIREAGRPLPTRDLLEIIVSKGIEVGGKDPVATLGTRLNRSSSLENVRPYGWRIREGAPDAATGATDRVDHVVRMLKSDVDELLFGPNENAPEDKTSGGAFE